MEAVDQADAVILVTDNFPPSVQDKKFVEYLQGKGKTDSLFMVINKIDKVPEDERESLVNARIKLLSEMGVRTRIFPLSCRESGAAEGLETFRSALVEYIQTGLGEAKRAAVERRIKNAVEELRKRCEETIKFTKENNPKTRRKFREEAEKRMKELEREVKRVINNNKREIQKLQNSVLTKWFLLFNDLKAKVSESLQNATDRQLNNPNQLLWFVQLEINAFLMREFQDAEDQIQKSIALELNSVMLPVAGQEGAVSVNVTRWDKIVNLPPELGSLGIWP